MRMKIAIALGIVYVVWGSTYLAIAVADRTLPPLLMLAVRFGLAGGLLYAWSAGRGDVASARLGRRGWMGGARGGGRGRRDRRRAAPLRRHGRHRVGRAAGCLGPDRAPRGDGAAVHGTARPHLLRSPPLARRARRHRRGTARRRAARRPERKRRSGRRRGDPRGGARLGRGLGLRPGCTAAAGAVSLGRDADAVRVRTTGNHGNRHGRG